MRPTAVAATAAVPSAASPCPMAWVRPAGIAGSAGPAFFGGLALLGPLEPLEPFAFFAFFGSLESVRSLESPESVGPLASTGALASLVSLGVFLGGVEGWCLAGMTAPVRIKGGGRMDVVGGGSCEGVPEEPSTLCG
ncbi:hypothetical protein QFZ56_005340 [Streptomyces achromogenes]|uniref:Secreted protein n=1 Tax=Streptomyces achromogenes TaxID=67255 RepID=A0ABU0Q6T3_STRAH|nr:hypothetical protein [Streptomyces achromogenes]